MSLFTVRHLHELDEESKALLRGFILMQRHTEVMIMGLKEDLQSALGDLATEVAKNTSAENSATAVLQQVAASLTNQIDAGATIQQIRDSISALSTSAAPLAAAIVAATPAAPAPAPAPASDPATTPVQPSA